MKQSQNVSLGVWTSFNSFWRYIARWLPLCCLHPNVWIWLCLCKITVCTDKQGQCIITTWWHVFLMTLCTNIRLTSVTVVWWNGDTVCTFMQLVECRNIPVLLLCATMMKPSVNQHKYRSQVITPEIDTNYSHAISSRPIYCSHFHLIYFLFLLQ